MSALSMNHRWGTMPRAARLAAIATAILVVAGFGVFVLVTVVASIDSRLSVWQVIFGPGPGMPVIVWLVFAVPAMLLQGLVALALSRRAAWPRAVGAAGALAIAAFCLLWFAAAAWDLVAWLATGNVSGDFLDLLGILFFGVPLGLAILILNARAGLLTIGTLRRHEV